MKLVGGGFSNSISLAGENEGQHPRFFRWNRSTPTGEDTVFFTDSHIRLHKEYPAKRRMALLVESPVIRSHLYRWIEHHVDEFDTVFTHQRHLLDKGCFFYPIGGSRIRDWGMFPKSKMTSILLSQKTGQEGHKLRHGAAKLDRLDAYGSGVGPFVPGPVALRDYRFSVVIENCRADYYFSEKLIDCISQGTVPIYWGCPSIANFFAPQGMILWQDLEELQAILKSLDSDDYEQRVPWLEENLKRAEDYRCAEDWIAREYEEWLWPKSL